MDTRSGLKVKTAGGESSALKIEIAEAITRRLRGDGRSASDLFGVALAAIGEVTADMIFSAAQDKQHGERLLATFNAVVRSRWNQTAA